MSEQTKKKLHVIAGVDELFELGNFENIGDSNCGVNPRYNYKWGVYQNNLYFDKVPITHDCENFNFVEKVASIEDFFECIIRKYGIRRDGLNLVANSLFSNLSKLYFDRNHGRIRYKITIDQLVELIRQKQFKIFQINTPFDVSKLEGCGNVSFRDGMESGYAWVIHKGVFHVARIDDESVNLAELITRRFTLQSLLENISNHYSLPKGKLLFSDMALLDTIVDCFSNDRGSFSINFYKLTDAIISKEIIIYERFNQNTIKPDLKYIVGIKKPELVGDYLHIDIQLVQRVTKPIITEWYSENKKEIYELVKDTILTSKYRDLVDYYKVGAITLTRDKRLHMVLELKNIDKELLL